MTTTTTLDAGSGAPGTGTTAQRLAAIAAELAGQFYERDAVVRALIAAMLAGQHSLLLGPPGTAKSELARELTGRIDGARYWEILLSKFTDPNSMFGALVKSAVIAPAAPARTTGDLAGLRDAVQTGVPAVTVPGGTVDAVCTLRASLRRQELICSDRRWKQAVRLLQASAFLAGRAAVDDADLEGLTAVLWESVAQRPAVEREVLQLVNPDAREALDLADGGDEIEAQLQAKHGQSKEHLAQR